MQIYVIESRGAAIEKDIYGYLAQQGNSKAVQNTLRQVIQAGKKRNAGRNQ